MRYDSNRKARDARNSLADRHTYHEARPLLTDLLPGVDLPEVVIAYGSGGL